MAERNWYYQVWVHCDHEEEVHVVETYKTEWQAQEDADKRNALVKHDTVPDNPPRIFFFVRPILAEELIAEKEEAYKRQLKEDTEFFISQYRGEFLPYAKKMVEDILRRIETCDPCEHCILINEGGSLLGYNEEYDFDCRITCSALYSGIDRVSLEVALVRMGNKDAEIVKVFQEEEELLEWLRDSKVAAKACEKKLIEICCDRFRNQRNSFVTIN